MGLVVVLASVQRSVKSAHESAMRKSIDLRARCMIIAFENHAVRRPR
jgi:hypothetical protein